MDLRSGHERPPASTTTPRAYALCLAGSSPDIPEGAFRIDLLSAKAKVLTCVQIVDDVTDAVDLQHRFAVRSTGRPVIEPAVDVPMFTNTEPAASALFERPRLEQALEAPDRSGRLPEMLPLLEALSDYVAGGPSHATALGDFVRTTSFPHVLYLSPHLSEASDGWTTTGDRDRFGDDVGFRTTANFAGNWWNAATEAIYLPLQTDATGVEHRAAPSTGSGSRPATVPATTSTATGR